MRHLKTYKIFESNDNVSKNLTEICYELTDGRFGIKIYGDNEFTGWGSIPGSGINLPHVEPDNKILFIYLSDYRDYDGFSFSEVRETVLRVIDYLIDSDNAIKNVSVLSVGEHERSSINRREIVEHHWFGNLTNLAIIYR